jgi:TP901 family phage tail tape measure protein
MAGNDIALEVILDFKKLQKQLGQLDSILGRTSKKMTGVGSPLGDPTTQQKTIQSTSKLTQLLNSLGLAGSSVGVVFGKLIAKVAVWLTVTTGVFAIIGLIRSLVSEMKSLEDATIRLQRVLPSVGDQFEADTKAAHMFAKEMNILAATTYDETLDALQDTVKAGFDIADSMRVARASLLATNVTELQTAEATRYFIATIRQFNLEATDSLWILNQWNELGKRTGATTKDIAEAVTRSGKAWKAVGGTLSELNAVAAATIEATGESGAKIGTMLKTLSARYADLNRAQSLNNELSKIGIRIQLMNSKSQNKVLDVISELSEKWDTLTKEQQANIAKAAAGVRQYSRFIGIVENFDSIINALIVSIDSNNSALSENERRSRSLDFALKQLRGSFQELALNSTGLLDLLKQGTRNLTSLLDIFGKVAGHPITQFIIKLSGYTAVALVAFKSLDKVLNILAKQTLVRLAVALKGVGAGMTVFKFLKGPIGLISLLVTTIGTLALAFKSAKREQSDFFSSAIDDVTAMNKSRQQLLRSSELLLKTFTDPRTTEERRRQIAEAFENVAGIDITRYFNTDIDKSIDIVQKRISQELSPRTIIENFRNDLRKTKKFQKELSLVNSILGSEGDIKKEIERRMKLLETGTIEPDTQLTKLQQSYEKATKERSKFESKNVNILFGSGRKAEKARAKQVQLLNEQENAYRNYINYIKQNPGVGLDVDKQLKIYETLVKLLPKATKDLEVTMTRISYGADEIANSTKKMYTNIVDSIFELKQGQTLVDNLMNAFQSFGEIVYNEMKNSIVDGLVAGMQEALLLNQFKTEIANATRDIFQGAGEFLFNPKEYSFKTKEGIEQIIPKGIFAGLEGVFQQFGAGAFTAAGTGRDPLTGGVFGVGGGTIGTAIGNAILPGVGGVVGGLLGGLVGGLLAPQQREDQELEEEQMQFAEESVKQLRQVNRNLTTLIEETRPWDILSESYFFSVANSRGLVNV